MIHVTFKSFLKNLSQLLNNLLAIEEVKNFDKLLNTSKMDLTSRHWRLCDLTIKMPLKTRMLDLKLQK